MKKVLFLIFVFLFFTSQSYALDCDQTFYGKLRQGYQYDFYDIFDNTKGTTKKGLSKFNVKSIEQYDYNGEPTFPDFSWTDYVKNNDYIINIGEKRTIIKTDTKYPINYHPKVRSKDNFILQYDIEYYSSKTGNKGTWQGPKNHTECKYYEISWCGDGIIDSEYGEVCDDGNDVNGDGCNTNCKTTPVQPTICHQTFYEKLRYGKKYKFWDEFYNNSNASIFLSDLDVFVSEQYDYNGNDSFPNFSWTDYIKNKGQVLNPGDRGKVLEADEYYPITYYPLIRDRENLFIKYLGKYYNKVNGNWDTANPEYHNECVYYEISRCGDGIVDNDYDEECDDGNEIDGDGCNKNCKKEQTPEIICTDLKVNPNFGDTPLNANLICSGENTNDYKIEIKNSNGNIVKKFTTNTTNYTFNSSDIYNVVCYAGGKTSQACKKTVKVGIKPNIAIDKRDVNPDDLDGDIGGNDSQTVKKGEKAIFKIAITNAGTEDLKDIKVIDTIAPNCAGTLDFINKKLGNNNGNFAGVGDHNDNLLQVGEVFTYTCSKDNTQNNYTNIASVDGVGAKTGEKVNDSDDTEIIIGDNLPSCTKLEANPNDGYVPLTSNFSCTGKNTTDYKIDIKNNSGNILKSINSNTTNYKFETNGVYTAICYAGGKTSQTCKKTIIVNKKKIYDLALKKTLASTGSLSAGDEVDFNITVYNQGNVAANNIEVTDYIPAEFELVSTDWTKSGNLATKVIPKIEAGKNRIISIKFKIKAGVKGKIINWAEISKDDGDDCDSTPDQDKNNDKYTTDDYIGNGCDSGNSDEDDHDPAEIIVGNPSIEVDKTDLNVFDLDKKIGNDTQTVKKGDEAIFKITIENNGVENLKNIVLSDLKAPDCSGNLNFKTKKVGNNNVTFSGNGNHNDEILQVGEIFSYTCVKNDTQENYTNNIKVEGIGVTSGEKVNDSDDTEILVGEKKYDLALKKTLSRNGPFKVGDEVMFNITVYNQGNVAANNVEVTDYIPTEFELVSTDWTKSGNLATKVISKIEAGENRIISIKFKIKAGVKGKVKNWAEISKDDGDDCDSTPDQDKNNDKYTTDDYIGNGCDSGNSDEDDHDPAEIEVEGDTNKKLCESLSTNYTSGKVTFSPTLTCLGNGNQNIKIDCGNGVLEEALGKLNNDGKYEHSYTCNYTSKGSYTAICYVNGQTNSDCSKILEATGGGNPNDPCGNGIVEKPNSWGFTEECDDGDKNGTTESNCSSNCNLLGGGGGGGGGGGSSSNYCGDGKVQRPNDNGELEECDFGSNDWEENWCGRDCKIKQNTIPRENGNIEITPNESVIIGGGMNPFEAYNKYPTVKSRLNSDIYLGKLCVVKGYGDSLTGPSEDCIYISGNGILKKGTTFSFNNYPNFVSDLSKLEADKKYEDNPLEITIKENNNLLRGAYFAGNFKVRVARPSVSTTGGGTSYVTNTNISNTKKVSEGIIDEEKNKNTSGVSVGGNLSSDTTEVKGTDNIKEATKDSKNYSKKINENNTNNIVRIIGNLTRNLDDFESYRGIKGARILKNTNFAIENTNLFNNINSPTTFIIENGNLTINSDITYSNNNLAFVVKGGDIKVSNNVNRLNGTFITIKKDSEGGYIISSEGEETTNKLLVKGSIYGNISDLTEKRTYMKVDNGQLTVGTIVSFGSSVFRRPAPLTSTFIDEYHKSTKVAQ